MTRSHATQDRIIDAAAKIYSVHGAAETSLRAVAELADVNLAAINYYFRSKSSLIQTAVLHGLKPIANERFTLLQMVEAAFGPNIQPAHVISCLIIPTLLQIKQQTRPEHSTALLARAAVDDTIYVREAIKGAFLWIDQAFISAFGRASTEHERHLAEWRTTLFCGAFPGSVCNHNLSTMCQQILSDPDVTIWEILLEFGLMAQTILARDSDRLHTHQFISDTLETIKTHAILIALQQHLPLKKPCSLPAKPVACFWPR
jgi:AcrR family transcriptional regulator